MRPISDEKRKLIVSAKKRKETNKGIALWLEVDESSVKRVWRLHKATGCIKPKKPPGRKPLITPAQIEQIKETVKNQPDITLEELIETLKLPIKKSRLSVILIEMGLSFKKRPYSPKNS
jgi:transposase